MPFEVFHLPESPEGLMQSIDRRLAAQNDAREQLLQPLMQDIGAGLAAQDKARTKLSRALDRSVTRRIRNVTEARQAATSLLVNGANASLSSQTAARSVLAGALLPAPPMARQPAAPPVARRMFPSFGPGAGTVQQPPATMPPPQQIPQQQPSQPQFTPGTSAGSALPWEGWYCLDDGLGGVNYVFVGPGIVVPTGPSVLGGPYATMEEAQAACPQLVTSHGGTHTGDGTYNGPGWYCIVNANGGPGVVYVGGSADVPIGTVTMDGPFATEDEANVACGGGGGGGGAGCDPCPTPDPCSTPPQIPTPPPGPVCKLIDFGDWTFPPIGSEDFCKRLPATIAFLTGAGQAFIDWLNKVKDDISAWIDWLKTAQLGEITGFTVIDFAIQILAQTAGGFQQILWDLLSKLLDCYLDLNSRFPGCNPTATLALMALKTLLSALHNQRIGTDAGLWWTLDFSTRLPQWERLLDYLIEYLCPSVIPSVGEAITTWTQGQITADQRDCWMKMHGVSPDVWQPVIISQGRTVSAEDIIYHGRRVGMTAGNIDAHLIRHGWTREEDRVWLQYLYEKQPTTGDAFTWLRGNLYNDELASKYGLDEGFQDFWSSTIGEWLRNQGMTEQTANYHYRHSFTLPNAQIAKEYLYRLRPDAVGADNAFTITEYAESLDFANLSPLETAWRTAVVYRPLTTGDVDQLLLYNLTFPGRLKQAYLDSGLNDGDAQTMTGLHSIQSVRQRAAQADGFTIRRVAGLVRSGVISIDQGNQLLNGQGYSGEEIGQAVAANAADYQRRILERGALMARRRLMQASLAGLAVGTIDPGEAQGILQSAGLDVPSAQTIVAAAAVAADQALAGAAARSLRGEYMRGVLSRGQVITYLQGLGITQIGIDRYMRVWDVQRNSQRRLLSASQAIRMVQDGLLTAGEAGQRLSNLGWTDPDRQLLLAEVAQKMAAARAKEEAAHEREVAKLQRQEVAQQARADRAAARQARAIEAARKAAAAELAKEQKRMEQLLRQSYPKGELKAWFKAGLVTASYVRHVLREEMYTDDAITLMIEEWSGVKGNGSVPPQTAPGG